MKNFIKISITILFGIIYVVAKAQSTYVQLSYAYDDNGNRISRTMTPILKKKEAARAAKDLHDSNDPQVNNHTALASSASVMAYPNPASDHLKIVVRNFSETSDPGFELLDHSGRLVLKKRLESETDQVNLDALVPGIYELRVNLGYRIEIFKLVKI